MSAQLLNLYNTHYVTVYELNRKLFNHYYVGQLPPIVLLEPIHPLGRRFSHKGRTEYLVSAIHKGDPL